MDILVAKYLKEFFPELRLGAIGPFVSAFPEKIKDSFDWLAVGEIEAILLEKPIEKLNGIVRAQKFIQNLVKIPDDISDDIAAAIMLKGMTAEYLIRRTYKVMSGQTVLFHAAAGGVGLIACQWLKAIGATVIGTVGSNEKSELAKANGCDHTILYKEEDFVDKVKAITNGKGVPVVYDSVGKDTALQSLDCLSSLGLLVIFGNSSGNAPAIEPGLLATKGSLYVTRPTLFNYNDTREKLMESANQVFNMVRSGKVSIKIGAQYDLKDAIQAHKDLEARKTTGCIILRP